MHYLLHISNYALFTAYFRLCTIYCIFQIMHYLLHISDYALFTA